MTAFRTGAFAAAILMAFSGASTSLKAADLPSGYTCQDLRAKVAEYGVKLLLASARGRGFSDAEIARIRGKCGV
jgi:hypothetical protein